MKWLKMSVNIQAEWEAEYERQKKILLREIEIRLNEIEETQRRLKIQEKETEIRLTILEEQMSDRIKRFFKCQRCDKFFADKISRYEHHRTHGRTLRRRFATKFKVGNNRNGYRYVDKYIKDAIGAKEPIYYDEIGGEPERSYHKVEWTESDDKSFSWSGVLRIGPEQVWPVHTHAPGEVYFIMQGRPLVQLGDRVFRMKPHQVLQIPPMCPHGVYNDGKDEVLVGWIYVTGKNKCLPGRRHNWKKCPWWESKIENYCTLFSNSTTQS